MTSGTHSLINGWLDVLKLPRPRNMVVAEDVPHGKPDPRCYLVGRSQIGLEGSSSILVLEDAPSGIRAGKSAGFRVLAVTTTHTAEQVRLAGADWIVKNLRSVSVKGVEGGKLQVEIRDAFQ